ncbi:MAG: PQQ-binding-like beta-propeller repeat protein, partial [Kiritimatiellaeota bacterium]|nr:PQQ-binding-like beta-propeller repeat protein [Kiritimatiellota bacterium]
APPGDSAPPAASVPASPFRLPRQVVDGIRVSADPAPERGAVEHLTDPLASAYSGATWSKDARPILTVRLPRRERVWSIELRLPMAAHRNALPEKPPPPFETTVNDRTVRFVPELDLLPLHKGSVYPFMRLVARDLQIETDTLRFQAPLTRIRRVRVRSERPAPLRLVHFEARDIDGDGAIELVAATAERELLVLDAAGRTQWRYRFPAEITAVDVDREILVATREARLYCLDAAGRQCWSTSFLDVPELGGDCPTAYSIARMGNRIVTGNYARATFLEPDGRVLNATFAYGAFETGWLPDIGDVNGDGVRDALLYNVWGTCTLIDGKARRAMGYVSCPRGALRLLRALDPPEVRDPRVLVVSENGAAMVHAATRKTVWRQAIAPVACATWFAGKTAIAKNEGALLLLDDSGNAVAKHWMDGAPAAMVATAKELYVADDVAVRVFDARLRPTRTIPGGCTALAVGNDAVFGLTPAGAVLRLP